MDAPRKIMLMSNSVLCALVLAYAMTPWRKADAGLATFVLAVVAVSGVGLGLALRRRRRDTVAPTGQPR